MTCVAALGSGLAGTCALTLAHQLLKGATSRAPRMDILGMRAITEGYRAVGAGPPGEGALYPMTLAGDVLSNSGYYSLVGIGDPKGAVERGALLGLMAGVGGVVLPGPLGLGSKPSARTAATALLTVGLYLLGGLVAGAVYRQLEGTPGA
jgi:hypothetical protein